MGTIRVGQKNPRVFSTEGSAVISGAAVATQVQNKDDGRKKRLAEIMALPEDERLAALVEAGFSEEAKELSERLSSGTEEHVDDGNGEENAGTELPVDGEPVELKDDEPAAKEAKETKKKSGSGKKSAKK